MIGDESGGGGLVDPHGVDPPAWAAPSDDAYGHLLTDGQQVLAGQPGRDEDDARDPYPQQALDGLVQDLGLVGADRDEQGEAARPRLAAICSKKALRRLGSTRPMMLERFRASEAAETLTRYPREAATSSMRSRVSAATLGEPLRASETRLRETPAARATSLWVAA